MSTAGAADPSAGAPQLLLTLLRAPGETRLPPSHDPRWAPALQLAERHGTAPLCHALLLGDEGPAARLEVPRASLQWLRRARLSEVALEARREAALQRVLGALAGAPGERPLPVLVYKGSAAARTLYTSPELRPRADLDLLVAAADAAPARERLERLGLRHHPALRGGPEEEPGWHEVTLHDPADPVCLVDLHRGLLQPERLRLAGEELLARGQRQGGLPGQTLLPAPEDAALLCALSLAAHELRSPLVVACDLARLLLRCDAALLAERARAARLARALGCSLLLLVRLGGGGPSALFGGAPTDPERMGRFLAPLGLTGPVRRLLGLLAARYDLLRRPLSRPEQLLRKALLIDRPGDAARFAWATLRRKVRSRPLRLRPGAALH